MTTRDSITQQELIDEVERIMKLLDEAEKNPSSDEPIDLDTHLTHPEFLAKIFAYKLMADNEEIAHLYADEFMTNV